MKVETLSDLTELLQALQAHGVSSYETPALKLCLGQRRPSESVEPEDWAEIEKRLAKRQQAEENALALAHVSGGPPMGDA